MLPITHERRHKIAIFKRREGSFIVHITYSTSVDGEVGHQLAVPTSTAADVASALKQYQYEAMPRIAAGLNVRTDRVAPMSREIASHLFALCASAMAASRELAFPLA